MCEGGTGPCQRGCISSLGPRAPSGLPPHSCLVCPEHRLVVVSGHPDRLSSMGAWSPRAHGACEGPRLAWLSLAACPCPPCGSLWLPLHCPCLVCLSLPGGCLGVSLSLCSGLSISLCSVSPSVSVCLPACFSVCVCLSASACVCEYVCLILFLSVCLLSLPRPGVGEGWAQRWGPAGPTGIIAPGCQEPLESLSTCWAREGAGSRSSSANVLRVC